MHKTCTFAVRFVLRYWRKTADIQPLAFFYADTAHCRYSTAPVWNCNGTTADTIGETQRVSSTSFCTLPFVF